MKGVDQSNEFMLEYIPPINDDININNASVDELRMSVPEI